MVEVDVKGCSIDLVFQTMEFKILTSTGMVSPGKTNMESPTRISSVGASIQIESEQSTSLDESSLSELITSLDRVDISDCKNNHNEILAKKIKEKNFDNKIEIWAVKQSPIRQKT